MPNNLIAIGDDGSGDKLCLKKRQTLGRCCLSLEP